MRHFLPPFTTTAAATAATAMPISSPNQKPGRKYASSSYSCTSFSSRTPTSCKHSPSATLDILILILVLFSCSFLIASYFSHVFHSLSLLPPLSISLPPLPLLLFSLSFIFFLLTITLCCGSRSRKCGKKGCKGLKRAREFDLKLQSEECLKDLESRELFGKLPWKGGTEWNSDYECLRSELRKMAPVNGRAVLLFRARCGCSLAKLEGWGPKRGRKHKRGLVLKGGDHH